MKENLKRLNNFFEGFIDEMIIKDIEKLIIINESHKTSYSYFALTFSGIAFFGGLVSGFNKGNCEPRSKWFMGKWMGKVNVLYKDEDIASLIYDAIRCGIFNNAIIKRGFNISSYLYPREKHLCYIKKSRNQPSSGLIFLHSIQFASDFIEAQKKFREDLNNSTDENYINTIYKNLRRMINEGKDDLMVDKVRKRLKSFKGEKNEGKN